MVEAEQAAQPFTAPHGAVHVIGGQRARRADQPIREVPERGRVRSEARALELHDIQPRPDPESSRNCLVQISVADIMRCTRPKCEAPTPGRHLVSVGQSTRTIVA